MNPQPEAKQFTTAGQNDAFNLLNQEEIAAMVGSIYKIITRMLGAVAGISLLVVAP